MIWWICLLTPHAFAFVAQIPARPSAATAAWIDGVKEGAYVVADVVSKTNVTATVERAASVVERAKRLPDDVKTVALAAQQLPGQVVDETLATVTSTRESIEKTVDALQRLPGETASEFERRKREAEAGVQALRRFPGETYDKTTRAVETARQFPGRVYQRGVNTYVAARQTAAYVRALPGNTYARAVRTVETLRALPGATRNNALQAYQRGIDAVDTIRGLPAAAQQTAVTVYKVPGEIRDRAVTAYDTSVAVATTVAETPARVARVTKDAARLVSATGEAAVAVYGALAFTTKYAASSLLPRPLPPVADEVIIANGEEQAIADGAKLEASAIADVATADEERTFVEVQESVVLVENGTIPTVVVAEDDLFGAQPVLDAETGMEAPKPSRFRRALRFVGRQTIGRLRRKKDNVDDTAEATTVG